MNVESEVKVYVAKLRNYLEKYIPDAEEFEEEKEVLE